MADLPQQMLDYLATMDQQRAEQADRIRSQIEQEYTHDAYRMVREAAVLGFFLGIQASGGVSPDPYPKDSAVEQQVLLAAQQMPDLYPFLGSLDA